MTILTCMMLTAVFLRMFYLIASQQRTITELRKSLMDSRASDERHRALARDADFWFLRWKDQKRINGDMMARKLTDTQTQLN